MTHLESDIVADMTSKAGFRNLVKTYGFRSFRLSKREQHVNEGGLNRTRGRLDLVYTTDVGKVVVEVQRGKSNNDHYERFAGYLSNFADGECVGLIWVAEEFTDMHIYMCQTSDNPIFPVEAKWNGKRFEYTPMLDMVECFGSYDMTRINNLIYKSQPSTFVDKYEPESMLELVADRNPQLRDNLYCLHYMGQYDPNCLTESLDTFCKLSKRIDPDGAFSRQFS